MNIKLDINLSLSLSLMHELGVEIVRGKYNSENFPTEAELFRSLSISRGVVREAIKMLESKGMLISKQNQGIVLRSTSDWNLLDADILSWVLDNPNVELIGELLQFQMNIEATAAGLAAKSEFRIDDMASVPLILQKLENPLLSTEQITKEVANFHSAILNASRNPFFCSLEKITKISVYANSEYFSHLQKTSFASYIAIYNAIINGDGVLANLTVNSLFKSMIAILDAKCVSNIARGHLVGDYSRNLYETI